MNHFENEPPIEFNEENAAIYPAEDAAANEDGERGRSAHRLEAEYVEAVKWLQGPPGAAEARAAADAAEAPLHAERRLEQMRADQRRYVL